MTKVSITTMLTVSDCISRTIRKSKARVDSYDTEKAQCDFCCYKNLIRNLS